MSKAIHKARRKVVETFIKDKINEKVNVLLPKSLKKADLIKIKPTHLEDDDWVSKCRWIIHSLIETDFYNKFDLTTKYVNLSSVALKGIIGNDYKTCIQELLNGGILETDNKYSTKTHKSYGFKLSEKFSSDTIKTRTISNSRLTKAVIRFREKQAAKLIEKSKPIAHLAYWLTHDDLVLDKHTALEFLQTYKRRFNSELKKRKLKPSFLKDKERSLNRKWNRAQYQLEHWHLNKGFNIDDSGGRLYSPLTLLPSIFKHFLTHKGEPLVSIDIKNSQPFHLLFLLKDRFWKPYTAGLTLKGLNPKLFNDLEDLKMNKEDSSSLSSYVSKKEGDIDNIMLQKRTLVRGKEVDPNLNYEDLVLSGKLYEFICYTFYGKFRPKTGVDPFSTRIQTKKKSLKMMYHNPRKKHSDSIPVFEEFKRLFPKEAEVMQKLKQFNHSDFPILLQMIEARMILHIICRRICDIDPTLPLYTIHDSIITTNRGKELVMKVINEEYKKHLGKVPQLEEEELSEDSAFRSLGKYVKGKVAKAEVQRNSSKKINSGVFDFVNNEHWDFELKLKKKIVVPEFAQYITTVGYPL